MQTKRRTAALAACLALSLPAAAAAQVATDDPSLESCIQYAEADHAKDAATHAARKVYTELKAAKDKALDEIKSRAYDAYTDAEVAAQATFNRELQRLDAALAAERRKAWDIQEKEEHTANVRWRSDEIKAFDYNVAVQRARNRYYDMVNQAKAAYDAAEERLWADRNAAVADAQETREAALAEPIAAHGASLRESHATFRAAKSAAEDAWTSKYREIFEASATTRSDVPEVLEQLRERHRHLCRERHRM